mgnify:CR=1 FL=1
MPTPAQISLKLDVLLFENVIVAILSGLKYVLWTFKLSAYLLSML